jgi:hypothetical protein
MVAPPVRSHLPGGAVADRDAFDLLVGPELDGELIAGRGLQRDHPVLGIIDHPDARIAGRRGRLVLRLERRREQQQRGEE